MASSLTWLDYDPAERERVQRVLALFRMPETRDEIGIGGIRDSFADQLFPGTSTIQTRLRYMLFVPWMYRRFEEEGVSSREVATRGREFEISLVKPLLDGDDPAGVFGRTAKGALKRLPSSVYWSGLGAWGIRRFEGSQNQYHNVLSEIYRRRASVRRYGEQAPGRDDYAVTWHPGLPSEPPDFPHKLDFRLTREEAEFLQERLLSLHTDTFLTRLATNYSPAEVEFPWEHPDQGTFEPEHKELLHHARLFSEIMHGAIVLYNLLLAEELSGGQERDTLVEQHGDRFDMWSSTLDLSALREWRLSRLWELVTGRDHVITRPTRAFVERWVGLAKAQPEGLAEQKEARELVRQREQRLKGHRSRFVNHSALEQWSGYSGLARLSYRWPVARSYLRDLHRALEGA